MFCGCFVLSVQFKSGAIDIGDHLEAVGTSLRPATGAL